MLMLRLSAVAMIVGGAGAYAASQSVDEATGLVVTAVVLVVCGVGMLVLAQLLAPIMRSSKQIAEQAGFRTSRLTGAPTMRSAMAVGAERMAQGQRQMQALIGDSTIRLRGAPGSATVKLARDTGQTSNLNPVYEVDLVVAPDAGGAYDVTVTTEVSSLAVAQCVPGTRVPVKVHPDDPQQVWVDWMAVAGKG